MPLAHRMSFMKNNVDTTWTDPKDPNFVDTGKRLVWRVAGVTRYSRLYTPAIEAIAWDKPRLNGGRAFAVGSRFGGFAWITLQITGRKETRATGSDLFGTRARVEFNIGPDHLPEDRAEVTAWVVG